VAVCLSDDPWRTVATKFGFHLYRLSPPPTSWFTHRDQYVWWGWWSFVEWSLL